MSSDPLKHTGQVGQAVGAQGYGKHAGLGLQFAATIGVFTWLGWYLDQRLGTVPWLLIAGVMLGFLGGIISLVRKVPPPSTRARRAKPRGQNDEPRPDP